jgi:hypothetical protein
MREAVGPAMGVKASGGVRTAEQAEALIAAGATASALRRGSPLSAAKDQTRWKREEPRVAGIDLRAFAISTACSRSTPRFLGTVAQGFLPLPATASLYVEIAPGIEISASPTSR